MPHFKTSLNDILLWRYMPIDKFMAILNDGALYFPKITSFMDKYEGKLPIFSRQNIQKENLFNESNTPIKRDDAFFKHKNMTNDMKDIPPQGIRVGVNINRLIQKIIMSPNTNEYFYAPLIKLVQYYGLNRNKVYLSDI